VLATSKVEYNKKILLSSVTTFSVNVILVQMRSVDHCLPVCAVVTMEIMLMMNNCTLSYS